MSSQNWNAGSYSLINRWLLRCWVDDHYVVTVAGWFEDICGLFSYQIDNAFVEGHDHNFITLFHNAKASVNDRCSVVCRSSNMVKATGDAQVAELTFAQHSKPTLTEENTVTNIIKLGGMREYEDFAKKWLNECDTGQYKSSGLRR